MASSDSYIATLNTIEQKVSELVQEAGLAISHLEEREVFQNHSKAYISLLEEISLSLKNQFRINRTELGIADTVLPFKSNTYTDESELVALIGLRDAMNTGNETI